MTPKKPKIYCRFTRDLDELLIECVSNHPVLFDTSLKQHKDNLMRDDVWREIEKTVGRPAQDCKTRWRTLRDLYNRKMKTLVKPTESSAIKFANIKWEYMVQMSFLKRVRHEKDSITNVGVTDDSSNPEMIEETETYNGVGEEASASVETQNTSNSDRRVETKRRLSDTALNVSKKKFKEPTQRIIAATVQEKDEKERVYRELFEAPSTPKSDPIKTFFDSMASTVMTFPPALAAQAKLKVCQIVTELECQSIEMASKNYHHCQSLSNQSTCSSSRNSSRNSPQNRQSGSDDTKHKCSNDAN